VKWRRRFRRPSVAKILLVDDDVDLVAMYEAVLRHRGHEVMAAYSAAEALLAVAPGPPEVFVLDVMMESETAGFELARRLHEAFPRVPAIMLSGVHAASGVPFRFEPDETWLPVVEFLDKPVQPAALADRIEKLLAAGGSKG
jgi:CheY-like chemotaxis protein